MSGSAYDRRSKTGNSTADLGIESAPLIADVTQIEQRLSKEYVDQTSELEQLRTRNVELRARNAELRALAETGWQAELQIKKLHIIEADLNDEVSELQTQLQLKEKLLRDQEENLQSMKREVVAKGERILSQQAAIERLQKDFEKAKEDFGRRVSELGESGLELEAETKKFKTTAESLNAELARLRLELSDRESQFLEAVENFNAQLSSMAAASWELELEVKRLKIRESDLGDEISEMRERQQSREKLLQEKDAAIAERECGLRAKDSEIEVLIEERDDARQAYEVMRAHFNEAERSLQENEARIQEFIQNVQEGVTKQGERESFALAAAEFSIETKRNELVKAARYIEAARVQTVAALRAKDLEIRRLALVKSDLTEELAHLHSEYKMLKATAEGRSREFENAREEFIATVKALEVLLSETKLTAAQTLQQRDQETAALRAKNVEQFDRMTALETEVSSFIHEIDALNKEISDGETALAIVRADGHAKDEIISSLHGKLNATRDELTIAHSALNAANGKLAAEIARANEAESAAGETADELIELRADLDRKDRLLRDRDLRAARSHAEFMSGQTKLTNELATAQAAGSKREAALTDEIRQLERRLRDSEAEFERRLKELQAAKAESFEAEKKDLERRRQILNSREEMLRGYANAVSQEKAEVLRHSKQLAEEIQSAHTLNPLKDYLSLTEFELSKLEVQLKKTPTLSAERPKLEALFDQMIEQRDFLKKTIATSQVQLERQAASLTRFVQSEKLAPIVPPPPGPKF